MIAYNDTMEIGAYIYYFFTLGFYGAYISLIAVIVPFLIALIKSRNSGKYLDYRKFIKLMLIYSIIYGFIVGALVFIIKNDIFFSYIFSYFGLAIMVIGNIGITIYAYRDSLTDNYNSNYLNVNDFDNIINNEVSVDEVKSNLIGRWILLSMTKAQFHGLDDNIFDKEEIWNKGISVEFTDSEYLTLNNNKVVESRKYEVISPDMLLIVRSNGNIENYQLLELTTKKLITQNIAELRSGGRNLETNIFYR